MKSNCKYQLLYLTTFSKKIFLKGILPFFLFTLYLNPLNNTYSSTRNICDIQKSILHDYYIDRLTGKILGRDRANTKKLRVIDKREWDYVRKEKGGVRSRKGTKELHKNSFVIGFDEMQIQKEIQSLGDDTASEGREHQLYIVLDVNSGRVYAKREHDPVRILNTETIIETYRIGRKGAPRVAEGLMLLAQVHGHPRATPKNKINLRSTSPTDREAARYLGISIFVVDAFDQSKIKNLPRTIHKVNKKGREKRFIGQTIGTKRQNTVNFTDYLTKVLRGKA